MDSTHAIAAGAGAVGSQQIASVLVWLTHWPIQPLTGDNAVAVAGLVLAGAAMLYKILSARFTKSQGIKS